MTGFKAHELGIVRRTAREDGIHLVIDRTKARYFGRPVSDAARGSTADRKFETIVMLTYAPTRVFIHYE